MDKILQILIDGKEWIFSGIGTNILSYVATSVVYFALGWGTKTIITKKSNKQSMKIGDNSTGNQAGRNININTVGKDRESK